MTEGMTLRQFIELLEDMVSDEPLGDQIEVVAISEDGEDYTPVVAVGPGHDGIRRLTVA